MMSTLFMFEYSFFFLFYWHYLNPRFCTFLIDLHPGTPEHCLFNYQMVMITTLPTRLKWLSTVMIAMMMTIWNDMDYYDIDKNESF